MRNRHTTDANATCKPYDRFSRSLKYIPEISLGSCFKRLLADPTILIRGQFTDNSGRGCIYHQLTRDLPSEVVIKDAPSMTRYFTGGSRTGTIGPVDDLYPEMESYQDARFALRSFDDGDLTYAQIMTAIKREIKNRLRCDAKFIEQLRKHAHDVAHATIATVRSSSVEPSGKAIANCITEPAATLVGVSL